MVLNWQIGVEIELIAPRGLSRETFARHLCPQGGKIDRFFHVQSEVNKASEVRVFDNLTTGFSVLDSSEKLIAKCVDDITIVRDCRRDAIAKPGWYRIVSDDRRFLELIIQQCDPNAGLSEVLNPLAKLFGTQPQHGAGNMVKVVDVNGSSIAIATPLPGERERPCEIITPPLQDNYYQHLSHLLNTATKLGFTIPYEGATHIHFDASALADTRIFGNLVNFFGTYGSILNQLVQTNPNCQRLGNIPQFLLELVNDRSFQQLSWTEATIELKKTELTKYCNFNLKNLVYSLTDKYTLEVRIFPVWLEAKSIIMAAELIEGILKLAVNSNYIEHQDALSCNRETVQDFLSLLSLSTTTHKFWLDKAITIA